MFKGHVGTPAVSVYLAGGLGNQLFMLAAAWQLAREREQMLQVETSFFEVGGLRALEVEATKIPLVFSPKGTIWKTKRILGRSFPIPAQATRLNEAFLIDLPSFRWSHRLEDKERALNLVGYFQSAEFFSKIGPNLFNAIEQSRCSRRARELISFASQAHFIAVHLRRGDLMGKQGAKSLSWRQAVSAILLQEATINDVEVWVFTDSPELARAEISNHSNLVKKATVIEHPNLSPLEELLIMSQARKFVLGPSTFGFWAAWLSHQRHGDVKITSRLDASAFWQRTLPGVRPVLMS
jgi:hypothetical protein